MLRLSTACLSNKYVREFEGDDSTNKFVSNDVDEGVKKKWQQGLFDFMRQRGTPIRKVPTLGRKDLDLYTLYHQVTARGGVKKVIASKLWRSIATALALPDSCTDYAFRLRLHYVNHLYPYEHCKYLNLADKKEGDDTFAKHSRALLAPQKTRTGRKEKSASKRSSTELESPSPDGVSARTCMPGSTTWSSSSSSWIPCHPRHPSSSSFRPSSCSTTSYSNCPAATRTEHRDDFASPPVSPCRTETAGSSSSDWEGDDSSGTPDTATDSVLSMSEIEIARAILGFQHYVPALDLDTSARVPWAKKRKV